MNAELRKLKAIALIYKTSTQIPVPANVRLRNMSNVKISVRHTASVTVETQKQKTALKGNFSIQRLVLVKANPNGKFVLR